MASTFDLDYAYTAMLSVDPPRLLRSVLLSVGPRRLLRSVATTSLYCGTNWTIKTEVDATEGRHPASSTLVSGQSMVTRERGDGNDGTLIVILSGVVGGGSSQAEGAAADAP